LRADVGQIVAQNLEDSLGQPLARPVIARVFRTRARGLSRRVEALRASTMVRANGGESAELRSSAAASAAALAAYLQRRDRRRVLHARQAAPIIVGESLVPAVIPFLRELASRTRSPRTAPTSPARLSHSTPWRR
jgi:hypothetical protein